MRNALYIYPSHDLILELRRTFLNDSAYEDNVGPDLKIHCIFQYSIVTCLFQYSIVTCRTVPGRATSTGQGVRPGQQDYVEFTGQV